MIVPLVRRLTLTFDDMAQIGSSLQPNPWSVDGVTVKSNATYAMFVLEAGPLTTNGTQSLVNNFGQTNFDLTFQDGSVFDLVSFDLGEGLPANHPEAAAYNSTSVTVTGTLAAGGTITHVVSIDGISDGPGGVADFQPVTLPKTFVGLSKVNFVSTGGQTYQFSRYDNIVFNVH